MNRYELLGRLHSDNKYAYYQENEYSKRNKKNVEIEEVDGIQKSVITKDKDIFLFLDTCTWLNQAEKGNFENFLKIADLAMQCDSSLLIPEQLTIEWNRHKEEKVYIKQEKTIDELIRKTTSLRDRVITDEAQKQQLTDLITQAATFKEEQVKYVGGQTIALVEEIMDLGKRISTDEKVLIQAAQWGLQNVPPFAPKKNSTADAVLFFSIMNHLEKFKNPILYFVTDNKEDFSASAQPPLMYTMHSQFIDYATAIGIEIRYFIILEDALNHNIEEVTDHDYIEKCESLYLEHLKTLPKCEKCGNVKLKDFHNWDGRGKKIFYKCIACSHIEETNIYDVDEIHDNFY